MACSWNMRERLLPVHEAAGVAVGAVRDATVVGEAAHGLVDVVETDHDGGLAHPAVLVARRSRHRRVPPPFRAPRASQSPSANLAWRRWPEGRGRSAARAGRYGPLVPHAPSAPRHAPAMVVGAPRMRRLRGVASAQQRLLGAGFRGRAVPRVTVRASGTTSGSPVTTRRRTHCSRPLLGAVLGPAAVGVACVIVGVAGWRRCWCIASWTVQPDLRHPRLAGALFAIGLLVVAVRRPNHLPARHRCSAMARCWRPSTCALAAPPPCCAGDRSHEPRRRPVLGGDRRCGVVCRRSCCPADRGRARGGAVRWRRGAWRCCSRRGARFPFPRGGVLNIARRHRRVAVVGWRYRVPALAVSGAMRAFVRAVPPGRESRSAATQPALARSPRPVVLVMVAHLTMRWLARAGGAAAGAAVGAGVADAARSIATRLDDAFYRPLIEFSTLAPAPMRVEVVPVATHRRRTRWRWRCRSPVAGTGSSTAS